MTPEADAMKVLIMNGDMFMVVRFPDGASETFSKAEAQEIRDQLNWILELRQSDNDTEPDPVEAHRLMAKLSRIARDLAGRLPDLIGRIEAQRIDASSLRTLQRDLEPLLRKHTH